MGLDMFLYREKYLGGFMNKETVDEAKRLRRMMDIDEDQDDEYPSVVCSAQVGYWRKANQIHRYFVDKHGNGVDECQRIYVTIEDLKELRNICKKVLRSIELVKGKVCDYYTFEGDKKVKHYVEGNVIKDPSVCEELLPTQEGFFFGSTSYDENYYEDIVRTVEILDRVIKEDAKCTDRDGYSYYYVASW